jgi:C1A family cysteine protease
VKIQGQCGASTAFASTAVVETCVKRLTGRLPTNSEQQYLECAFEYEGSMGCGGAPLHAYLKWSEKKSNLTSSVSYPYTGKRRACKANLLSTDNTMVNATYYTYNGTEQLLQTLVATRSSVAAALWFNKESLDAFVAYTGGVFDGCTKSGGQVVGGQAVAVVGYGREGDKDFWLVKNSWGAEWGEKGFMRLRRGVGACQVGSALALVDCTKQPLLVQGACPDGEEGGCDQEQEEGEDEEEGEVANYDDGENAENDYGN